MSNVSLILTNTKAMQIQSTDLHDAPWSTPERLKEEDPECPTCGGNDIKEEDGSGWCMDCGSFEMDGDLFYKVDYSKPPK